MKSIILHDFEVRNALKNDVIQIRRPVKYHDVYGNTERDIEMVRMTESGFELRFHTDNVALIKCPFGQPGDQLWVKETWCTHNDMADVFEQNLIPGYYYKADGGSWINDKEIAKWRSPIIMPREASRITLEVEGVRVEPVQNINHEDAVQEGVIDWICNEYSKGTYLDNAMRGAACSKPERTFALLWNSIYAKKGFGWDNNLPVWVGKFKVVERK